MGKGENTAALSPILHPGLVCCKDQFGVLAHGSTASDLPSANTSGFPDLSPFTVAGAAPDLHWLPVSVNAGYR